MPLRKASRAVSLSFAVSGAFSVPESAQRWANQVRQENEIAD
ncbi:hypothetical protein GAT90_11725 [Salmonella enterica]|nr:hypothetical protein [Salmonella enterica]HDI4185186.1 hypothetical protein [Salmonella enterica]